MAGVTGSHIDLTDAAISGSGRPPLVLVVEDDQLVARLVEINLERVGFAVAVAHSGGDALAHVRRLEPDAVLLDVMMPGLNGYEVCDQLRRDPCTSQLAIIMLTAKSMSADAVLGLTVGADDYIPKPFEPDELVGRVRAAIRRSRQLREVSPLTGLPGNGEIVRRINDLITTEMPFAFAHADLDHFKPYNDRYGFVRGDEAIRATATVLAGAITTSSSDVSFLGHIGGDDFALIVSPDDAEPLCELAIERFDAVAPSLYDAEDAARGYIEVHDRRRVSRQFGLMTISIGVATTACRPLQSVGEAATIATELKGFAKQQRESAYRIDRRRLAGVASARGGDVSGGLAGQ